MADEETGIGFLYSGWCQAALPHRKLPNDQGWQLDVERVRLIENLACAAPPQASLKLVGIPYGSRARLILLRLQSEALRTNSRDVELGRSLRDWLERMGIPIGGRSLKDVRDQTERISRCRLTFEVRQAGRVGIQPHNIMEFGCLSWRARIRRRVPCSLNMPGFRRLSLEGLREALRAA